MRKLFVRMPVFAGNVIQVAGLGGAVLLLNTARSAQSTLTSLAASFAGWLLLYFCCHAIAHWLVGRLLGIRFSFYTVGGTANPSGWPRGIRWIFERLPFFGVQTEKASMQRAAPVAKAIMWCAGVTSSAVVPTSGIVWAWHSGIRWANIAVWIALGWTVGTLISNWTSAAGDFSKARRALASSVQQLPPNVAS